MKNAIKVLCFVLAFIIVGTGGIWFYLNWDRNEYDFVEGIDKGTVIITGYKGEDKEIVIPRRLRGKKVARVGEGAFQGSEIEKVEIGGYVTVVEKNAFLECKSLKSVKLDEGVRSLGESAFYECNALESITIPSSLEKIEEGTFSRTALKDIDFSNNDYFVTENGAIYNKDMTELYTVLTAVKLKEYVCPDTLKSIRAYAFLDQNQMKSIKFNNKITKINSALFVECTSLTEVTLPDSLVSIENLAFATSSVRRIYIPAGVKKIDKNAFFKLNDQITIVTPAGSKAENFAKKFEIKYENGSSL